MNDKPVDSNNLSPEDRAKYDAWATRMSHVVQQNSHLAGEVFNFLGCSTRDVWCTLAYMKGSLQTMLQLTDQSLDCSPALWKIFEEVGSEMAKKVVAAAEAAAGAAKKETD